MEKNIYIKAMEIGYHSNDGINYFLLKEQLQKALNIKIEKVREYTLVVWFLKNFQTWDVPYNESDIRTDKILYAIKEHTKGNPGDSNSNTIEFERILAKPFYMKGETVKQYLDYLELKEAREQAKDAQVASTKAIKIAYWSVGISAFLALTSIILTLYFSLTAPKPPFDVYINEKPQVWKVPEIYSRDAEHSHSPDNEKD
ncbi:hypothetical protein [Aequorivita antarctica]|uniref:Uncharacterized protein n=1 Tax=Aequorivita antarctica TaxID=153266 RepID=A0A5C6YYK1_9FLAO|nr:hypothetical protein [Aequorivita antarctica]TXD72706.1 hypothetical protein ESU54_10820 [Aequorivita antarctica]SRX74771.1 hypothetical protein AEQU3_01751 [Aequorivita antarctica]